MTTHLLPAYARIELAFERGEGAWLTATDGERYLDFASGVAVNALGHAHPHVVEAITEQAKRLLHVSNLYRIPEGERLADRLCAASFADTVFFCNSGAEAMECVIKMVRKYQSANGHPERYRIITFEGSFHGRTLATLAAAKQKKHLDGFGPVMDGFDQVPLGDIEARQARHRTGDGGHPDRAGAGRGRHPHRAAAVLQGAARSSATSMACCSRSTKCRPASAGLARCSAISGWA